MRRLILKSVVAALAMATVGMASAQISDRTFKMHVTNPKGHPMERGGQKLSDLVAEKSGGKLKIKVFSGGTLGNDQFCIAGMQAGNIEMVLTNGGIMATFVKDMAVFDFPFMFDNPKQVDAVLDGPFGKYMHDKLEKVGVVGLGYMELGYRNMTNSKRPIYKAEDIAGLKLRVIANEVNIEMMKAMGANPVPMAFTELFTAMETKNVDGQENPISVIDANRFYEVQKYLTLTRHQYNPQSMMISKKVWDQMSAEEHKIFLDSMAEASKYQRQFVRDYEAGLVDKMKKAGMTVTELPQTELAKLKQKMVPVIDKLSAPIPETVNMLKSELAKHAGN